MRPPDYRPEIDGLRALAIVAVVAFHAFPEWFPGGFVGVDVFFVISGYLITGIIAGNLAAGTFSFAEFYARRVRRIFPALMIVLAAVLAAGAVLLAPEDWRLLSLHAIAGATFTSNFLLWSEAGYFDIASELKPFLHLWSLAIEEQFYLAWPLIAWLAWKLRGNLTAVAAVLGGASFAVGAMLVISDPDGAFYSPLSRMWELMIGCALAAPGRLAPARAERRAHPDLDAAAGLLLILASVWLLDRDRVFPGGWALMPTIGTALLLRSGADAWVNRAIFARGAMVKLGLASYALYLWHWPLLAFLSVLHPEGAPAALRLAAVLLATLLAWCTYEFVEKRIRRLAPAKTVPALAGVAAAVVLAGFAGYRAELGADAALEARLREARAWPAGFAQDQACRARLAAPSYCAIDQPAAAPTHALIGDSQANHFFPGLAGEIGKAGGNLINFGAAGCAPLAGVDTSHAAGCKALAGRILSVIEADANIHTVILAANWHPYARGSRFSAYQNRQVSRLQLTSERHPAGTDGAVVFTEALAETVDRLSRAGKRIVIFRQVPEAAMRYETCLQKLRAAPPGAWEPKTCAVPRRRMDRYAGEYTGLIDAAVAGKARVTVLDPFDALCDADYCYWLRGNELLYRDEAHLSVAGSRYVAARLWPAAAASR